MRRSTVLLVLVLAAACWSQCSDGGEKGKLTFGYLVQDLGNQYWVELAAGIREVCDKEGINLIVLDARTDPAKELANAEDLIQKKVDYILLSPWDSDTGATAVEVINKAGIPVSILDIGITGDGDIDTLVVSENFKGGMLAGEYIADVLLGGDNTKVVGHIQCQLGYKFPALRGEGFTKVMKDRGIKIVAKQPADSQRSLGMTVMQNMLQAHPEMSAIFSENDEMGLGALEAVNAAGLADKIKIVGFDANPDAIESVKTGGLAATIIQPAYEIGKIGAAIAIKSLAGEKIPKETLVPVHLLTREDIVNKKFERYH